MSMTNLFPLKVVTCLDIYLQRGRVMRSRPILGRMQSHSLRGNPETIQANETRGGRICRLGHASPISDRM